MSFRALGLKAYLAKRAITMFAVLMITLLLTILLVGSNMDTILKQGVMFQVRAEIVENPSIAESFTDPEEFEAFIQQKIDERVKSLRLDTPWYSPQRVGLTMYKILILDFGNATFLTSDSGSSNIADILLEKIPRTIYESIHSISLAQGLTSAGRTFAFSPGRMTVQGITWNIKCYIVGQSNR